MLVNGRAETIGRQKYSHKGNSRRWTCQPPERGTNHDLHDFPSPVMAVQVWHARQAGMCKAVCSTPVGLVFCVRTISFSHRHYSPWAAEGSLDSPEHWSFATRNRGWNQKWVCSHHDSTTHGLPWQYPLDAALHAFFWLLRTTWLVLTPQPHCEEVRKFVFSYTILKQI